MRSFNVFAFLNSSIASLAKVNEMEICGLGNPTILLFNIVTPALVNQLFAECNSTVFIMFSFDTEFRSMFRKLYLMRYLPPITRGLTDTGQGAGPVMVSLRFPGWDALPR